MISSGEYEQIRKAYKTEENVSVLRGFIEKLMKDNDHKLECIWDLSRDLRAYKTHVKHLENEI